VMDEIARDVMAYDVRLEHLSNRISVLREARDGGSPCRAIRRCISGGIRKHHSRQPAPAARHVL
jgi:hypothetical protein